jgi:DNA-binding PadR family transcriptional regulator
MTTTMDAAKPEAAPTPSAQRGPKVSAYRAPARPESHVRGTQRCEQTLLMSDASYSTIRTMAARAITRLGFALLGLLQKKPSSGYELRKIFTETPMGSFSDSPGAIYPALARLEDRKLLKGKVERGPGLRERRVLQLTPVGLKELKAWLTAPIGQSDVVSRMGELMLRFSFLDGAVGTAETLHFLQSFEAALNKYVPRLSQFLKDYGSSMPRSGRLALESGALDYAAKLQWVRRAILEYRSIS